MCCRLANRLPLIMLILTPLIAWAVQPSSEPAPTPEEYEKLGLRIVLYPVLAATAGMQAAWQLFNDLKQRGIKDADKAPIPDDIFRPQAEQRVRLGLVVAEVVRGNTLHAKPEQIKAHIEELAASYERPEDVVRWYNSDNQRLAEVEAVVIESNVSDFVLAQAKVVEKAITFEELMGQQA